MTPGESERTSMKNTSKPGPRSLDEQRRALGLRRIIDEGTKAAANLIRRGDLKIPTAVEAVDTTSKKARVVEGLKAGRRQVDIAHDCGVSQAYVSRILASMPKGVEA